MNLSQMTVSSTSFFFKLYTRYYSNKNNAKKNWNYLFLDLSSEVIGIRVAVYTLMVMIPLFVIFLIGVSVYFLYRTCHPKKVRNEDEASLLKHKVMSNQVKINNIQNF